MAKRPAKKPRPASKRPAAQPPPTLDERIIDALRPWLVEIGGLTLFLSAMVTLLGLLGFTRSNLLAAWINLCRQIMGWGAFGACLLLLGRGVHIATRRWADKRPYQIRPLQVVGLEMVLLAALPLSHLILEGTLSSVLRGQQGGLIGWALAEPMHDLLGPWPTYLIYGAVLVWGMALIAQLTVEHVVNGLEIASQQLRRWAEQLATPPVVTPPGPRAARKRRPAIPATEQVVLERPHPLPPYELLQRGQRLTLSPAEIEQKKQSIEKTLRDFGLPATVVTVLTGPAITQFGLQPGHVERPGPDGQPKKYKVRVGQIARLNKDLTLALAASRVRIEAPVPGEGIVGIEVPNSQVSIVRMGRVIDSAPFRRIKGTLGIALGEDVSGTPIAADVTQLPHLLVAGQTGAGKSVFINSLISCLVFNNTPDQLRLVMIDPKKVELIRFNGLPHLIGKVEVEGERAIGVLRWLTAEMDERYRLFAKAGARHLAAYNATIAKQTQVKPLPHLVAFVDELADLMAQFGGDVESALCRLAQMARATGIHLIVSTQRPSTDVLTGLIKANFPSRVSFAVASGTDSRVVLDTVGAEHLLGQGDMLYVAADASAPVRIQGCFVNDEEIDRLVAHWQRAWPAPPQPAPWENLIDRQNFIDERDDLLERAIALTQQRDTLSTSLLQRRLRVGFPRAARLMETLHEMGLVEDPKTGGRTRRAMTVGQSDDPLADFLAQHDEPYRHYPDKPNFDHPA